MNERPFIAHKAEDGRVQTIEEHQDGTGRIAAGFADAFGAREVGWFIGKGHDIGKFSMEFLHRIYDNGPPCDHSTAAGYEVALMVLNHKGSSGNHNMLGNIMSSHHTGLMDLGSRSVPSEDSYVNRIRKAVEGRIPEYKKFWKGNLGELPPLPDFGNEKYWEYFYGKFLYSCLIDGDRTDTEIFMRGEEQPDIHDSIPELLEILEEYLSAGKFTNPENELNRIRCCIMEQCRNAASGSKGIYSMTVPTGGGKTLSSMLFALRHAAEHKMDRIIYVIPYTSIIEQTADIFKKIFGGRNVLEHHSNMEEIDSDDNGGIGVSENWNVPIIVTTSVQFFESLYGYRPSVNRKVHNIANSVVIFDEAQQIPVDNLVPCVHAIAEIVKHFRSTAVLCTATQPYVGRDFENAGVPVTEIVPKELSRQKVFSRITFRPIYGEDGDYRKLCYREVANNLSGYKQVLCIVNTKKTALEVYKCMEGEGTYHLSALMHAEDRRRTIAEIKSRLKDNSKTCRVISTSLIEAGVDIDFPVVYRELCGLDSVLQAAGRCNREGKRNREDSFVYIFCSDSNTVSTDACIRAECMVDITKGMDPEYFADEACISDYFRLLYFRLNKNNNPIDKMVRDDGTNYFRTIGKEFRLIKDASSTVYIPDEACTEEMERLKAGIARMEDIRKLNRFSVKAAPWQCKEFLESGYIERCETLEDAYILANSSGYSHETGLIMNAPRGVPVFL